MKTKISALQFYLMLFLSRVVISITINAQTIGSGNWLETIFSSVGLFLYLTLFFLPILALHRKYPALSLMQIAGKDSAFCIPLSVIYALYFVIMNTFSLSLFLTLLMNTADPAASRCSIAAVILIIALYGAIRGIETVSRASICVFALFLLGMAIIFLAVSPNFTPRFIQPLFRDGLNSSIRGFVVFTARCSSLAEFAVLMPFIKDSDKSHTFLRFTAWNGSITVFLSLLLLFLVSCLGEYALLQIFPAYTLASIAEVSGIQRLDALFIGIAMMALIVRIACGLFCIAVCMTPVPARPRAFLTGSAAALIGVLSLYITGDAARTGVLFRTVYLLPLSVLTGAVLPSVLWVCDAVRSGLKRRHAA